MIRPVFTEIVLFLIPFAIYAIFLATTRKGLLDSGSWPLSRIAWLAIAALVMMIGSFVGFAQFGGSPLGSTYTPAHVENGRFVPGRSQ